MTGRVARRLQGPRWRPPRGFRPPVIVVDSLGKVVVTAVGVVGVGVVVVAVVV